MALDPIIPPDPIEANVDYRYDGCYQSMVLVMLQRLIDASGGGGANPQLQEIIDELTELNGKVATEATLEAARVLLASLDSKDFATETTLASVKLVLDAIALDTAKLDVNLSTIASEATLALMEAVTSQMTFTGGNLNVNASVDLGSSSTFGDSAPYTSLTPTGVSQTVLSANTDFKEVILYHENKKKGWLKLGGDPAVIGEGFPLEKKQIWALDRCRSEINIIFESGFDAKKLQINTTNL